MIKTIIAGEALTRALEKQQRFVESNNQSSNHHVIDDRTLRLQRARWSAEAERRTRNLRMAKATVPSDGAS